MNQTTLNEEIAAILTENCNNWMTTLEIAEQVNERNIYFRQNNLALKDFPMRSNQITGSINIWKF